MRGPESLRRDQPGPERVVQYNPAMLILANAGVPMIYVVGPVFLLALIPIILIEAAFYQKLAGIQYRTAAFGTLWANLISTVAGVPATWVILVILQLLTGGDGAHGVGLWAVTWQAAWLIPYENELGWMIPTAAMVLNVPFFFVSVGIENLILRTYFFKNYERRLILRACWKGNMTTYVCLTGFWFIVRMNEM